MTLRTLGNRDFRIVQVCLYVVLLSAAVGSFVDGSWFVTALFFLDLAMASYVTVVALDRKKKQS